MCPRGEQFQERLLDSCGGVTCVPQILTHPGPVTVTVFGNEFLGRHLFPPIPADHQEAQTFKNLDISRETVD